MVTGNILLYSKVHAVLENVRNTPAASWKLSNYYFALAWIVAGSHTFGIPHIREHVNNKRTCILSWTFRLGLDPPPLLVIGTREFMNFFFYI